MNDEHIKCPKCDSMQKHVYERDFKTGRTAIAGGLLTGNILLVIGNGSKSNTSKKILL